MFNHTNRPDVNQYSYTHDTDRDAGTGGGCYQLVFPPGSVGVCFETAFNPPGVVVKSIQPNTHAAKSALSVGDKLISINDTPIAISSENFFDSAMSLLKDLQGTIGSTLTFMSVTEQSRLIRQEALCRLERTERLEEGLEMNSL